MSGDMSNLIDKEKLMEWLWEQYIDEGISMDRAKAYQMTRYKIYRGDFDTEQERGKMNGKITGIYSSKGNQKE